jgi:hypothetical protein
MFNTNHINTCDRNQILDLIKQNSILLNHLLNTTPTRKSISYRKPITLKHAIRQDFKKQFTKKWGL